MFKGTLAVLFKHCKNIQLLQWDKNTPGVNITNPNNVPIEKKHMDAFLKGVKIARSDRGITIIGTARFLSDQPFKYYKDNEKGLMDYLQKNKVTVNDTTIKAEYAVPMGVFVKCIPSCTNMEDTISELKDIRWPKETPREEK